jgi:hypothetical protein
MNRNLKSNVMKRTIVFPGIIIIILMITSSCEDRRTISYMANVPVYLNYSSFRKSLSVVDGQIISRPGKIYFMGNHLFINELEEGIHIIDISNPASPLKTGFIEIPGNYDMAVRGNYLYADSYVDLVIFDITNLEQVTFSRRIENFFSDQYPPYDYSYPVGTVDNSKGVVVGWKVEEVSMEVETGNLPYRYRFPWSSYYEMDALSSSWAKNYSGQINVSATGQGGSMAKFIIYKDFLYMLDDYQLKILKILNPEEPEILDSLYVGWGMETVFIADDFLYMGAQNGMSVFSLSDPGAPVKLSTYWHVTSCDPVVVQGNTAFVTMRSGNTCEGTVNRLDVVSVDDKRNPVLLKSYDMQNPHGLGIDDNTLFICEGEHGLKVFDASNIYTIKQNLIAAFPGIHAFDVIPVDGLLFLIGDDGLSLYDYEDPENITPISSIPVIRE